MQTNVVSSRKNAVALILIYHLKWLSHRQMILISFIDVSHAIKDIESVDIISISRLRKSKATLISQVVHRIAEWCLSYRIENI